VEGSGTTVMLSRPASSVATKSTLTRFDQLRVAVVADVRLLKVPVRGVPPQKTLPVIVMLMGIANARVLGPTKTLTRSNGPGPVNVSDGVLVSAKPNQSVMLPIMVFVDAESNTAERSLVGVIVYPASVYGVPGDTFTRAPIGAKSSNPIVTAFAEKLVRTAKESVENKTNASRVCMADPFPRITSTIRLYRVEMSNYHAQFRQAPRAAISEAKAGQRPISRRWTHPDHGQLQNRLTICLSFLGRAHGAA
jgi:hypothetical protein